MLPDYEIELGRGIGNILLGMQKKELADVLGVPDDIEIPENPEKTDWETYVYNSINCSFSFDPGNEHRLAEIVVENGYFHIGRKIRVGVTKEELLRFGSELKFGKVIIEDAVDEAYSSLESVLYEQAGLHLWLEDGRITAIQIKPLLDEKGLQIWPEQDKGQS